MLGCGEDVEEAAKEYLREFVVIQLDGGGDSREPHTGGNGMGLLASACNSFSSPKPSLLSPPPPSPHLYLQDQVTPVKALRSSLYISLQNSS